MNRDVLLTGATGFIGGALLQTWLSRTEMCLHLIVRPRRDVSPQERMERLLSQWFSPAELPGIRQRIVIHVGDVTAPLLGMETAEYDRLAGCLTQIIHCAASARFDLALSQARSENVGGVESVLTLAEKSPHLRRLDYVGTAYRLGEGSNLVHENDRAAGAFRNSYEQSKYEAEMLLLAQLGDLPIMVARPSIVLCDSHTGAASSHNGFCRALTAYLSGQLTSVPGCRAGWLDIVPVDYVAAAMFRLCASEDSIGHCYHLTAGAGNTYTLLDIQALSAQLSGLPPFTIAEPNDASASALLNTDAGRSSADELRLYAPYLRCHTRFDNTECVRLTGLRAPDLCTYYPRFIHWIQNTLPHLREVHQVGPPQVSAD